MSSKVKRLYRSRDDRYIAGVAGGLADFFNTDPTIVRVLLVILIIATYGGFALVYIVMAIIVPEEKKAKAKVSINEAETRSTETRLRKLSGTRKFAAITLIVIGIIILMQKIFPNSIFGWEIFWAVLLVVAGVLLLFRN